MKVIALYSSSIDGKIAKNKRDSLDWISSDSQKFFRAETTKGGIIVMGRKTYENMDAPLEHRYNVVITKKPSSFKKETKEGIIEFTKDKPKKLIKRLQDKREESIFLIGGQEVFSEFLKEGLIDEVWMTIEPILIGKGVEPFQLGKDEELELELLHLTTLSKDTVLLKYEVTHS